MNQTLLLGRRKLGMGEMVALKNVSNWLIYMVHGVVKQDGVDMEHFVALERVSQKVILILKQRC